MLVYDRMSLGEKMSEKQVDKNESEQIWNEIKDLPIAIFALANQTVQQHVVYVPMRGSDLLLKLISTAALPALEETLNSVKDKKYEIEVAEHYTIVRRASSKKKEIQKALGPFLVAK